ncbi:energy-coupling factor transporter transmembrane protein EcfT [Adlercreutzia sp. ZJ305]|uniref:energy-coupling factor transporter transmembrane component T family protein n=2 Tax=unclassified Adlercreutzia TaxID=2636013 RepID=UPI0013ECED71|nr:energy-coupling factor transporter transmembrane component T [Adlercreutzia sp. ZJ305]
MQTHMPASPAGSSPVHRLDARAKVAILAAYSAALFFVDTWAGMACMAALLAVVLIAARLPPSRVLRLGAPAFALAALSVLFNFADPLRGCFLGARIVALVLASFAVSLTSTSTELANALASLLRPARRLGLPADDVAAACSVALRFIPLMYEELIRVRDAQWSRGAAFDGGLAARLRAWGGVFVPVLVGLFRRADVLAQAMDARCYGAGPRTALSPRRLTARSAIVLAGGCALCALLAVVL